MLYFKRLFTRCSRTQTFFISDTNKYLLRCQGSSVIYFSSASPCVTNIIIYLFVKIYKSGNESIYSVNLRKFLHACGNQGMRVFVFFCFLPC